MYKKYETLKNKFGVTDAEISRETGISQSTLSDWKMGRYEPKVDKLLKIAKFFNVSLDYFMEESA